MEDTPLSTDMFDSLLRDAVRLRVDAWVEDADTQDLLRLLSYVMQTKSPLR